MSQCPRSRWILLYLLFWNNCWNAFKRVRKWKPSMKNVLATFFSREKVTANYTVSGNLQKDFVTMISFGILCFCWHWRQTVWLEWINPNIDVSHQCVEDWRYCSWIEGGHVFFFSKKDKSEKGVVALSIWYHPLLFSFELV